MLRVVDGRARSPRIRSRPASREAGLTAAPCSRGAVRGTEPTAPIHLPQRSSSTGEACVDWRTLRPADTAVRPADSRSSSGNPGLRCGRCPSSPGWRKKGSAEAWARESFNEQIKVPGAVHRRLGRPPAAPRAGRRGTGPAEREAGIDGMIMGFLDYNEEMNYFRERVLPLMKEAGLRH